MSYFSKACYEAAMQIVHGGGFFPNDKPKPTVAAVALVISQQMEKLSPAEKILDTLERQEFADWYNKGRFDAYISGDLPKITKPEILADISKMFKL